MNNLRDYYERALQEFGTSDDGEQSLNVKGLNSLTETESHTNY